MEERTTECRHYRNQTRARPWRPSLASTRTRRAHARTNKSASAGLYHYAPYVIRLAFCILPRFFHHGGLASSPESWPNRSGTQKAESVNERHVCIATFRDPSKCWKPVSARGKQCGNDSAIVPCHFATDFDI